MGSVLGRAELVKYDKFGALEHVPVAEGLLSTGS